MPAQVFEFMTKTINRQIGSTHGCTVLGQWTAGLYFLQRPWEGTDEEGFQLGKNNRSQRGQALPHIAGERVHFYNLCEVSLEIYIKITTCLDPLTQKFHLQELI